MTKNPYPILDDIEGRILSLFFFFPLLTLACYAAWDQVFCEGGSAREEEEEEEKGDDCLSCLPFHCLFSPNPNWPSLYRRGYDVERIIRRHDESTGGLFHTFPHPKPGNKGGRVAMGLGSWLFLFLYIMDTDS